MTKLRIIVLSFIATSFISCNNLANKDYEKIKTENDSLRKELIECNKTIEEFKNTPQIRFSNAQKYLSVNEYSKAINEFKELIEKYPETEDAKIASSRILYIEDLLKKEKEQEERRKTLGYKILNDNNKIKIVDVLLSFTNVTQSSNWTFDSYGDEYRYRDAERGTKYIVAKISISSETKDPKLPPVLVYNMKNGVLNLLGTMEYRFSRWEDYASYLGNDADYGNDFAHSKTVRFSCGLQIPTTDLNNKGVFVVVRKTNCFYRDYHRLSNPPVSYINSDCNPKDVLTINDFNKEYVVVKVFNRNKL